MSLPVNQDQNIFKADEEVKNSTSTVIPECIQSLPQSQPSSPDLTNEETSKALKSLLQKDYIQLDFPKRTKFRVDPHLPGQSFSLISFIPSRNARPDSQGCFGVLKVRGTFPNINEAERWAENLVRGYDSYSEIDITYVGKDFPIMADNSIYCESTREIDVRKKIEDTIKENIKQKKEEEKKEIEEIQERQNRLLNEHKETKQEEEYVDLDYYTQLRVKKANAQYMLDECNKRIKECNEVIDKTQEQISNIDTQHPDYKDEFLQKYKNALDAIGANAAKNPLIKYMSDENVLSSIKEEDEQLDRSQPYATSLDNLE